MILVDSSVWIDYFCGTASAETDFLDSVLGAREVAIGDLILTEVLQGFRRDKNYNTAKGLLAGLTCFELLGAEMAIQSADNFRTLRKKGLAIRKTADVIIASFCTENDLPLLFSDNDFRPFVNHLGLCDAMRP